VSTSNNVENRRRERHLEQRLAALERGAERSLPSVLIYEGLHGEERLAPEVRATIAKSDSTTILLPAGRCAASAGRDAYAGELHDYPDDERIAGHRQYFKSDSRVWLG
jgi:hypothetical protein